MVVKYKRDEILKGIISNDYKKTLEDIAKNLKNIYDYLSNEFFKKDGNTKDFSIQGDYLRSSYADEKGEITKKSILNFLEKRIYEAEKEKKELRFEIAFVSKDRGISLKFETPREYIKGLRIPFLSIYILQNNRKKIELAKYESLENICKEIDEYKKTKKKIEKIKERIKERMRFVNNYS